METQSAKPFFLISLFTGYILKLNACDQTEKDIGYMTNTNTMLFI